MQIKIYQVNIHEDNNLSRQLLKRCQEEGLDVDNIQKVLVSTEFESCKVLNFSLLKDEYWYRLR